MFGFKEFSDVEKLDEKNIDEELDFLMYDLIRTKLKENGYFIRVLPDADHLLGIKQVLYKNVILNVMKESLVFLNRCITQFLQIFLKNTKQKKKDLLLWTFVYRRATTVFTLTLIAER